ncbi:TPA: SIR2 family protein [Legionella pneumophila]|nr:SIR2 family protein [Legionella pneumophila]
MSSVTWPSVLVDALARTECVLFVGAGFTKNAISPGGAAPVSWTELLTTLLDDIAPKNASGRRPTALATSIAGQIRNGDLLWAAQALEASFAEAGRLTDFKTVIAQTVDGLPNAHFQPGEPHTALLNLDARTLVTTNYDKVLERLFGDGYAYLTYKSDNIAESIRTGKSVVLKLHGTTDDPQGMILTRLDFAELRRHGGQALTVLEALTLTRTVLFLGYSLDDPDLHLILENQLHASGSAPGHYLLAHARSVTDARRSVMNKAFGVQVVRYDGDYTDGFLAALKGLVEQVQSVRAERLGA